MTLAQLDHNIIQVIQPTEITITESNTTTITVPINANDDIYEGWGLVDIALADGADYTAASNAMTRSVTITDNQTAPVSVLIDAPVSVVEDEDFTVTLTATNSSATQHTNNGRFRSSKCDWYLS